MTLVEKQTVPSHRSHGIALPTVLVMLLLSSVLALSAWRSVWLNALLLRARADAVRTHWATDATLQAALDDVLQRDPMAQTVSAAAHASRHDMGAPQQQHVFFPKDANELNVLRQRLGTEGCREGICAPLKPLPSTTTFWKNKTSAAMPVTFEQTLPSIGNACYWVEVFLLNDANQTLAWVYRITAMVTGLKSTQPVVLQAIWLPHAALVNDTHAPMSGRWVSWAVLHD